MLPYVIQKLDDTSLRPFLLPLLNDFFFSKTLFEVLSIKVNASPDLNSFIALEKFKPK